MICTFNLEKLANYLVYKKELSMQDRYAGDIGDFGKFGLLKHIENEGLSIGEIAIRLKVSKNTVYKYLLHAKRIGVKLNKNN